MGSASVVKFIDNTGQALDAIEQATLRAMKSAVLTVEGQAKLLTPVDTGALRDSMTHEVERNAGEITGKVGSSLDYAIYHEFGTGEFAENGNGRKGGWGYEDGNGDTQFTMGTKPKKMLRTAIRKTKPRVKQLFEAELGGVK